MKRICKSELARDVAARIGISKGEEVIYEYGRVAAGIL